MPVPPASAPPALALRQEAARLRDAGQLAEGLAVLQRAVAAAPADAEAHAELGLTFSLMGKWVEAEPAYRRALDLGSEDLFTLSNLAGTLKQLRREHEAEPLLRAVLARQPDHEAALRNLAVLLKDAGQHAESRDLARRAAALSGGLETTIQAELALTPMIRSAEDIATQRAAYAEGLETLTAREATFGYGGERLNLPWYYLPYHGLDDRALLARTAEVLGARVSGLADADLSGWHEPVAEGRRIHVAICSEFLQSHTIGRLYRGLVRHLDRSRFEVTLLHTAHGVADADRAEMDRTADRALVLPHAPAEQRTLLAGLKPDVLFYPDIGMSAVSYLLALSRLAPVQVISWGHPVTSGSPAMDYYLSAEAIEPPEADEDYTERLIRLGRLPCYYDTPAPPPQADRAALTLPETGTLYGCPQTLFKLHPEFDAALAAIAAGDPQGHIVLIESRIPAWMDVLKARWATTHPELLQRVTFLRRLNHAGFMAHLAHIDVLLDPFHFGSGNTLYEGLSMGTPIVTWPGRFMRSRIVAGAYRQMGVADAPVAGSPAEYVGLALALGRDGARRARLKAELQAKARTGLYEDMAAVREFETFLVGATAAAGRGERLARGWRPAGHEERS